jgi:hypothetical protein
MLLNIIPPICISFYQLPFYLPLFIFYLFFLYCFGIYEATKRPKIVLNAVLLNLYYLFFHMGFVIMWISKKYSEYLTDDFEDILFQLGGFICIIVFMVGGIH